MKQIHVLFLVAGGILLIHEIQGQRLSQELGELTLGRGQAASDFKCPWVFGVFADPDDCSYYIICIGGKGVRHKCVPKHHFDIFRRRCLPENIAICDNSNKDKKTTKSATKQPVTSEGDSFVCSSFSGSFPHPKDCSKYYSCFMYISTAKTCPAKKLFDAVKKSCEPESKVHCGTRQRPGVSTPPLPETTTPILPTETETPIVETETTIITTTEVFPTGPPEHNCDEDDVDCIVDETGDPAKWFKCPDDIASFPHPSSDKLFIFCMNWIPSVKRCGLDMVFSKETNTCVSANSFM